MKPPEPMRAPEPMEPPPPTTPQPASQPAPPPAQTPPPNYPSPPGHAPTDQYGHRQPSQYGYQQTPSQGAMSSPPMAYPQYGGDPYGYGQFGAPPVQRRNGMGLAAMTLGILSVPLVLIPFLGIVLGILAVVFGILGMKRAARSQATNKGQALTGVICGAVGVVGAVIFFAWAYDTAKSCIDKYDIDTPAYNQCIRDKVNGTG